MEGQRFPLKTSGSATALLIVSGIAVLFFLAVGVLFSVSEQFTVLAGLGLFIMGIAVLVKFLRNLKDRNSVGLLIEQDSLTVWSRSAQFSFPTDEIVSIDWIYYQPTMVVVKTEYETGIIRIGDFSDPVGVIAALRLEMPLQKQQGWETFLSMNLSMARDSFIAPTDSDQTRDFIRMQRDARACKRRTVAVMWLIYGCLFLLGSLLLIDFHDIRIDMRMMTLLWLFFAGVFFPARYLLDAILLNPSRVYPKFIPVGPRGQAAPDGSRYFVTTEEIYPRSMEDRRRLATIIRSYLARETTREEFARGMMDFKMEKGDATVRNIHTVVLLTLRGSLPLDAGQGLRQMLQRSLLMLGNPRSLLGCLLESQTEQGRLRMNVTLGCCCLLSFGWVFVGWWFIFVGLWICCSLALVYQFRRRNEQIIVGEKMMEVIPFFPYENEKSLLQAIENNLQLYAEIEGLGGGADIEAGDDSSEPMNINLVPLSGRHIFFWIVLSPILIFLLNTEVAVINGIRVTEKGLVVGEIVE